MKFLKTFFGQVLRKQDVDFQNQGSRDVNVQTHIDFTDKFGGVISGLDVFKSIDSLTILITPGIFYSSGEVSETNNLGGGERGRVYTTQSFTGLPQTPPIANQESFLLVYSKVISTNSNPDPTKFQTTVTSKNIQTGENVLTREFPAGTIVVSNPILESEINKFNGIPLALIQVDFVGTSQQSSNGTIQTIKTDIKRNYTVGGVVDLANKAIVPEAIPNNFITSRMIGPDAVTVDNLATGTVSSPAIAIYDGGLNVTESGNGVATGHLKDGAVTEPKLNYDGSLDNFTTRNYILNSSFEKNPAGADDWVFVGDTGTSVTIETDPSTTKFGLRAAKLLGGSSGSPGTAKSLSLSQKINFNGPINGRPLSAFFYAKLSNSFNLAISGTTGISGKLEFFDDFSTTTPTSSQTFFTYSGIDTGDFIKIASTGSIIIPTTDPEVRAVNFVIEGAFDNTVHVDGAFLGISSVIPGFSLAIDEQVASNLNADNINAGTLKSAHLADGAVTTSKIRNADGSVNPGTSPFGIMGGATGGIMNAGHIRSGTITNGNIADATIGSEKLQAGVAAVPAGSVLMFDKENLWIGNQGCPPDFDYIGDFEGRFAVGSNRSAGSNIPDAGDNRGTPTLGNTTSGAIGASPTNKKQDSPLISTVTTSDTGGGIGVPNPFTTHDHSVTTTVPFRTVIYCRKKGLGNA